MLPLASFRDAHCVARAKHVLVTTPKRIHYYYYLTASQTNQLHFNLPKMRKVKELLHHNGNNSHNGTNARLASSFPPSSLSEPATSSPLVSDRLFATRIDKDELPSSDNFEILPPAIVTETVVAPVLEHVEKPAVVQEIVKQRTVEEIQPVVHREREQLEIREEVQPIYEQTVLPTVVEEKRLEPEIREEVRLGR